MYRTMLENAFPIVLVFLIGAWSDKYGRKLPMLFVISAFLLQNLMLILCAYFEKATGAWSVAVVSSLIASLSGKFRLIKIYILLLQDDYKDKSL